ncbi:MAG TPA: hypothetical protein IAA54_05530 [Candidatus Gallacutalibacter pullicola]|uniref:Uncharacterized protein n=1 Tax=Candidatus Gallacutalibacter pullicola TaxID=2840830 RepID=A0A9D1J0Z8_9FIRM|nr:hypothetical protein [Candidatus Gallacutalibacter pullicola]
MKLYKKEAASGAANTESGRTENFANVSIFSLEEFSGNVKSRILSRKGAIA